MPVAFKDHPLRLDLANEVHARPFIEITAPQNISHFAMTRDGAAPGADREHIGRLCESLGCSPPPPGNYAFLDFGAFSLRWESHTEFSTWTFLSPAPTPQPFADRCLQFVPADWLAAIPGLRIAAVNVALLAADQPIPQAEIESHFIIDSIAGSRVVGGDAQVWNDFQIRDDGYGRILIQDLGMKRRQAGRLVQRMLEIETYRMMALLGLPVAQAASPKMQRVDRELADLMPMIQKLTGSADEDVLLERLISLGTEIERITVDCDFRFGATKAYYALVERRIEELREERTEGLQTLGQFVERRLAPAMRTCTSVSERLRTIGERLARCSDLLRTRVDIARENQNQQLLNSMDRRAQVQLGLQATVEGLSIAAISYYAIGLLLYFAKGIEEAGAPIKVNIVMGLATPVICLVVWYVVRRIRRGIMTKSVGAGPDH